MLIGTVFQTLLQQLSQGCIVPGSQGVTLQNKNLYLPFLILTNDAIKELRETQV